MYINIYLSICLSSYTQAKKSSSQLHQAADAGVAALQYELGLALFNGDGVTSRCL